MDERSQPRRIRWRVFSWLKGLYDWVLSWAHTRFGSHALFWLSFAESSFFPVPPDALLVAMGVARPKKSLWYAFLVTLGSLLGAFVGYAIGFLLFESVGQAILSFFGLEEGFAQVGVWFADNAFLAILGAAFSPIPFKVFTIAGGVWQIGLFPFLVASALGRAARFFIEAILLYFFGARIGSFIEKYFNVLTLAGFLLLVCIVLLWRYLPV